MRGTPAEIESSEATDTLNGGETMRKSVRGITRKLALLATLPLAALAGCAAGAEELPVASGTEFSATLDQRLSTKGASAGDAFTATVAADVVDDEGRVVIPAGATLHGEITDLRDEGSEENPAYLQVAFNSVEVRGGSVPLSAEVTDVNPRTASETHDEAAKIGGGAAAGALLGALVSGGDAGGTVAGAAVGAAAGTAITLGTAHQHAYLPAGSRIGVRLTESTKVPAPEEEG